MRKFTILLAGLLIIFQVANAQTDRQKVAFEIFTGVNCPYCPAAANGAYDMLGAGKEVAIAAYHTSSFSIPQFYTTETIARASFYGVTSYPTTKVDGILTQSGGGGAGSTNYGAYLGLYNQRIGVQSDFSIDASWENISGNDYELSVTVEKVGTSTPSNLKLVVCLTESHIAWNWQGMSQLSFVTRDMLPTNNGTAIDFASGNVQEYTLPFTMDAGWERNNCELVIFVQSFGNKEIHQSTFETMLVPDFTLDAELYDVMNIPENLCEGVLEPEVTIRNMGADAITSLNINFEVNGDVVYTYPWTGSIEFFNTEMIEIPEFTFDAEDDNTIVVTITDPNGGTDENPDNDSQEFETTLPETVTDMLVLIFKTDDNPGETTWEVFNANGDVIGAGGPYSTPQQFLKDTVFLTSPGCHQFVMYDAAGNGLATYYTLRAVVNGSLTSIYSGGAFGYKEASHFIVEADGIAASFSADLEEGCEELTAQFTDASFGDVTSWDWTFEGGDPATSNEENPYVYYANSGDFDVTLTVSDGTNSNTLTLENFINVYDLPDVQFSALDDMCVYWPEIELAQGTPAGGVYEGPGVTDGWFYPEDAGVGTHTLTYTFEDANGCENYAEQTVYVDDCVGISEPGEENGIEVYPNPLTSNSSIRFNLEKNENVVISLFNNLGYRSEANYK